MKRKIDWLNHGLEFAVVLVGILIAFQLNNWSLKNDEKDLVELHMESIIKEAEYNQNGLKYALKNSEGILLEIDTLLDLIKNEGDINLINDKAYGLLNVGWLYLRINAYNSLNESGDIRLIKNFEQRKRIVDLYEYYAWTESVNKITYSTYSENVFPYLKNNLDFITRDLQDRSIYKDRVFLNGLSTYRYSLNKTVMKFKDCKKVINTFLEK